jgi:DNA gyrase/topoisomerase IV subunit A
MPAFCADRTGMRMVVEVKKGFSPSAVLQSLFANTKLQSRFPINIVALLAGQPLSMGVRDILGHFLDFRYEALVMMMVDFTVCLIECGGTAPEVAVRGSMSVDGQPCSMGVRDILCHFLDFRCA